MGDESELFIVLSNTCNFKCSHCVSMSAPIPENKFSISLSEITDLVEWIKNEARIKRIHFSGGEPTLHLDLIQLIQVQLPNLSYAMTTNGWFGKNPDKILGKMRLDLVFFSYDQFHKPFIDTEPLRNAMGATVRKGIRTFLKFTVNCAEDFALIPEIMVPGVKIVSNSTVLAGRARKKNIGISRPSKPEMVALEGCPSLREDRIDSLERIVFHPGKGLSPCCGPLVDPLLGDPDLLFTKTGEDYFRGNRMRNFLMRGNFLAQVPNLNVPVEHCKSQCSVCEYIYGRFKTPGLRSDIMKAMEPSCIPLNTYLDSDDQDRLKSKFRLAYFLSSSASSLAIAKSEIVAVEAHGIRTELITEANQSRALDLFIRAFERKCPNRASAEELADIRTKLGGFLVNSGSSLLYYSNNQAVGLFGIWRGMFHYFFQKKVNHVGVYGYDSNLVNKTQAQAMKQHWYQEMIGLVDKNNKLDTTVRIDTFNLPSLKLAHKFGFMVTGLEISP